MIIKNPIYFDLDDTLILWDQTPGDGEHRGVGYKINTLLVEKMISYKKEGKDIIVWSQAGADHAIIMARKAGFYNIVDHFITKPSTYYDDKLMSQWGCKCIYPEGVAEEPRKQRRVREV